MVKKHYKVIWDDEAKASLRSIYQYFESRESIEQARKVRDEIIELAQSLRFMPRYRTRFACANPTSTTGK